ncbi:hypothetical protein [Moraxella oblonga]|uniref:hypothetical protein n=1 Tax=Moraxella oblonga TaxID=200413 RepID=UPI0008368BB2|nr:hypothetical protein [Moraxella oblonga]
MFGHESKKAKNLSHVGTELDASINFKINSNLKAMFDDLCKKNHSTMAREIKIFITNSVANGRLGGGRDVVGGVSFDYSDFND